MKSAFFKSLVFTFLLGLSGCNQRPQHDGAQMLAGQNKIHFARGFSLCQFDGYAILTIKKPWPTAAHNFTFILKEKEGKVPDSLQQLPVIHVPLKSVVVTSTTHIPSLEMLGVENKIVGFPNTNYVSSQKTRRLIDSGKIREVGNDQSLNTELLIELSPDAIVAHGVDNSNSAYDKLQNSGLPIIFNGDWNENSPLGKAEWIKFFGALFQLNEKAEVIFKSIVSGYHDAKKLARNANGQPTVFSGAIYQNQWYMPKGNSWAAQLLQDANCNYLWKESTGTGSLALSFETVFMKASKADFWIGPGEFTSRAEMLASNTHYGQFRAFKNNHVYSFSSKKGKTGGVLYYELAPNRPDLVLKDIIKIVHPELLPDYQLQFFEKVI